MASGVRVARVYDPPGQGDGRRVLVDRLWPRGIAKEGAPFDEWVKDAAPSTELRRWYGHRPERFEEFARRYRDELAAGAGHGAVEDLRAAAGRGLVLVTATRDVDRSAAAVLRAVLTGGGDEP